MDVPDLLASVPDPPAFRSLSAEAQKAAVERFVSRILDAIDAEAREPDAWETATLGAALAALRSGMVSAALIAAQELLTPAAARPPDARSRRSGADGMAMRWLRTSLRSLRGGDAN
jgi:hypothetical protein